MTTNPESARALLDRHGLPEDVIDGVLCLHAQELAAVQRAAISDDSPAWVKVIPDLIDPTLADTTFAPATRAALRDRIAAALYPTYGQEDRNRSLAIADAVLAVLPEQADRAAVLREAAESLIRLRDSLITKPDVTGKYLAGLERAARELRRLAAEEQPATEAETEEQRADREETERDHAAGNHQYCDQTCEVEFPTEALRNFILAKGYPGTAGMLDELLRRAAAGARQDGAQQ